jgi:quercetin dioxygenase-like cupin family protein
MSRRLRAALLGAALALVALAAGPPLVSALTATLFVSATLEERVKVNNDGIRLKTKRPTEVHMQELRFSPGDFIDWHHHAGFALIAVKSGTITFLGPDCRPNRVGPGEAVVESAGPTYAVNEGSEEALTYATYVVPEGTPRAPMFTDPPPCATGEDEDNDDDYHGKGKGDDDDDHPKGKEDDD